MPSSKRIRSKKETKESQLSRHLISIGVALCGASLGYLLIVFFPIVQNEVVYALKKPVASDQIITPKSKDFGLVIPKIGANSPIVANVDPYTESSYQRALTKGIAHAQGTAFPGTTGTTFLFSHSSVNFYEATRYNSVFYLIDKLAKKDEIHVYYKKQRYVYAVTEKKIVDAKDISYLTNKNNGKQLVLMTCWPAGTSLKRLLIIASITPES